METTTATENVYIDSLNIYPRINRWINTCDLEHEECRSELPQDAPDWVIDVTRHCIVPGETVNRYIALSYVWNNDENGLLDVDDDPSRAQEQMLFERNLRDFQVPGFLLPDYGPHLPRIISDAMALVRSLGMRYLWIDRLCIVQDAANTRETVEKMDKVYSGAYFTIIAAVRATLSTAMNFPGFWLEHAQLTPEWLYSRLQCSKWAGRGWTFQEMILSERIVVFVEGLIFWECSRCMWVTDDTGFEINAASNDNYRHISKSQCQQAREAALYNSDFRSWLDLICLYNDREFTYPQDALAAFSGILNVLSTGHLNGFIGGLPLDALDVALLWQPRMIPVRRTHNLETFDQVLPSWSCFGWRCPIDPHSLRSGLAGLPYGDNKKHAASWRTQPLVKWSTIMDRRANNLYASTHVLGPCLRGSTTRAFLHIHIIFTHDSMARPSANISMEFGFGKSIRRRRKGLRKTKFSVFSLSDIERVECQILWLFAEGRKVGLLRQMGPFTPREPYAKIELIAISLGSATLHDLEMAFEERRDIEDIKSRQRCSRNSSSRDYKPCNLDCATSKELGWNEKYYSEQEGSADGLVHFYNVLWIDRQGDVVIRIAAGRVSKMAWEKHCSGPVDITLA